MAGEFFNPLVSSMINAIATAAEEQSAESEEVSKNIEDISNVCKNTASYADNSFGGIKELSNMLKRPEGDYLPV